MKEIIEFFTKADGKILDPFCGVGGARVGAALAFDNREAGGISDSIFDLVIADPPYSDI